MKNNFSEVYSDLLKSLINSKNITEPRGLKTYELLNVQIKLNSPYTNLFYNKIRFPKLTYLYPELLWYFLGKNDLNFISKYSKFWNKIANEDNTINSAYGYLIFNEKNKHNITEYQWALNSLIKDINSRQAILRFNKPNHSFYTNKDFVCTLNIVFNIRKDLIDNKLKLNINIIMRSQDIWYGIIYDLPFFSILHQQMHRHLLKYYPELELGTYNQYIISLHLYEKNIKDVKKMLEHEFIPEHIAIDKYDLINENGFPSNELNKLYTALINNEDYFVDDLFFNNLYKYSYIGYYE